MEAASSQLLLAEAVKELVRKQGVEGTTVQQIVYQAKLSRKTFYKYFLDKYELINWICFREWSESRRDAIVESGWEAFRSILEFLETDRAFYAAALRYTGQNSFGSYLVDCFSAIIGETFHNEYRSVGLEERWTECIVRMLADDAREAMVNWLELGEGLSPEEFFEVTLKGADVFVSMLSGKARDAGRHIHDGLFSYSLSDEQKERLNELLDSVRR